MNTSLTRVVLKTSLSYLLILIIPFALIFKIYHTGLQTAVTAELSRNIAILNQVGEKVDSQLQEVKHIAEYISSNPILSSLLQNHSSVINHKNYFDIYTFCNSTPNYKQINQVIDDIYIFSSNLNYVIQLPYAYRLDDYLYYYHDDLLGQKFYNQYYYNTFLKPTPGELPLKGDLVFITSLPYGSKTENNNQLIIKLNDDLLFRNLQSIDIGTSGAIFVLDQNNHLMTSFIGEDTTIHLDDLIFESSVAKSPNSSSHYQRDYIISSITTGQNQWRYISVVPKAIVKEQVTYIRKAIIFLITIAFIITILLLVIIIFSKSMFFVKSLKRLKASEILNIENPKNYYDYILQAISLLVVKNNELHHTLESQKDLTNASLLHNIFYGYPNNQLSHQHPLHSVALDFNASYYAVMIHKFNDFAKIMEQDKDLYTQKTMTRILFKETLSTYCPCKHYFLDMDSDYVAILFLMPKENMMNQIKEEINQVDCYLKQEYHLTSFFGLSPCCTDLLDVQRIFAQVQILCQYAQFLDYEGIVSTDQIPMPSQEMFYYPLSIELKLIQHLQYNDISPLEELLDHIYEENFVLRHLSLEMIQQFLYVLRRTIFHYIEEHSKKENDLLLLEEIHLLVENIKNTSSITQTFKYIVHLHKLHANYETMQQASHNAKMITKIEKVIQENYHNSHFNLAELATLFHLSEASLYHDFKNWFNVSFCDYLEHYRIQMACELLAQKDILIKDIAPAIGYNSDYSFRRAFKRILGVTPSQYIQSR